MPGYLVKRLLALLVLVSLSLLASLASIVSATSIDIWHSCDETGVFVSVHSDTPFTYMVYVDGRLVASGQANSDYNFSWTQPGTYELVVLPTNGDPGKWVSLSYDGSTCTCSGACSGSDNGGGSGGGSGGDDGGGNSGDIDMGNCDSWCSGSAWFCNIPIVGNVCKLLCDMCTIVEALKSALKAVADWFVSLKNIITSTIGKIVDGITAVADFFTTIADKIISLFTSIGEKIVSGFNAAASFMGSLAGAVYDAFSKFFELITAPFRAIINKLGGLLGGASGSVHSLGTRITGWMGPLNHKLFLLGVALMIIGAFAGGRARILFVAGMVIIIYVMFTDESFKEGITKSPYLAIAAGLVVLIYAAMRLSYVETVEVVEENEGGENDSA